MPTSYRSKRSKTGGRRASAPYAKRVASLRATTYASRSAVRAPVVLTTAETKYFDTGFNHSPVTTSGTWTGTEVPCDNYVNSSGTAAAYTDSCLIPTAIGSAYGEVNGNRFKMKKIRVRGLVAPIGESDEADIPTVRTSRLMLVMDTQPNGAQAQGEDVMQDVGANETQWSFKRIADSSGRFRILKDEFFTHQVSGVGTDGANTNTIGFEAKPFSFQYTPNVPITVNVKSGSSVPTIASAITCNIFMLLSSNGISVQVKGSSRCYYCD